MKSYIKLPELKAMSDSISQIRMLSDQEWKSYIFYFILKYYKETNLDEITKIINDELQKQMSNLENELKIHIRNWLVRKCPEFNLYYFILNLEPKSNGLLNGFYDLKFEHSLWRDETGSKYFTFEAKNIGEIKSLNLMKSIKEYVYIIKKDFEDGGMFRYMNGKYAPEMSFGGMIGFLIGNPQLDLIDKLITQIKTIYENRANGRLIKNKILKNSINNNPNTFDTIHERLNHLTGASEEFCIHHIIMDFTQSDE